MPEEQAGNESACEQLRAEYDYNDVDGDDVF
jgi:hypothetical protein